MKKIPLSAPFMGAVLMGCLWSLNYYSGVYMGRPFLYCWMNNGLSALYLAWGTFTLYLLVVLMGISVWTGKIAWTLKTGLAITAIIELPRFISYLFNPGGSCV